MARGGDGARRYPIVGGATTWILLLAAAALGAGAAARVGLEAAAAVAVLGWMAHTIVRGLVVECGPAAITRGLVLRGRFLPRVVVIPWRSVTEVGVAWAGEGDDSTLVATVRGADGGTIRFSTSMGLPAFWACLADVVRSAPHAGRSGLTAAMLSEGPPGRRHARSSAAAVAMLALILLALAALHHVWAQGRSSLARYLEEVATVGPSR
jgi:hypothetical protein